MTIYAKPGVSSTETGRSQEALIARLTSVAQSYETEPSESLKTSLISLAKQVQNVIAKEWQEKEPDTLGSVPVRGI
jgi:hypothetical protein